MEAFKTVTPLIKTKKLVKKYKEYCAVDHVSMTINKGDIYGFIGKNGAGKTTFIRLLTKLIQESSGILDYREKQLTMGAVIEGPVCYPYLSAKENLEYYAIQLGIKDKKRVAEVLKFVGLETVDPSKKFKDYSLGMKQRLGIGVAILDRPTFLILDEPVNGLDPQGIVEIREIIQRLNQEFGTTILISSHILTELSLVATRYGIINQGKLIKELTADELEKECQKNLIIETSDDQQAKVILYSNGFSTIEKDGQLVLPGDHSYMETISKKLYEQGIYMTNFYMKEQNLEDYFLKLLEE